MIPSVAQVVVGLPVEGPFDYLIPDELSARIAVGMRVLVRFSGRKRMAVVTGLLGKPTHAGKLSVLIKLLDETPVFSSSALELAKMFSERFACTQGEALELALPAYLRKPRLFSCPPGFFNRTLRPQGQVPELVFDQGQTRRWEILLPRISRTLDQGRGVLVLVPDTTRCHDVLPKLGPLIQADKRVLLTQGSEKEEYARWLSLRCGKARLAAGFISAVLAPVQDLGLIVIMEEESPSYKHDQSPFYHARDVALMRGALEGCDVVCVSSAPSVELWHQARQKKVRLLCLEEKLPPVNFLDLTNFKMRKGSFLSLGLRNSMEAAIRKGERILLYIQAARGVAPVLDEVKKCFPSAAVAGYDKSSTTVPDKFDVLVATQSVFRHRAGLKVDVAVILDIDWEFHKHDHQATHGAFALVQYLRQMARGQVLAQTRHITDPLLHSLAAERTEDFYHQELALRKEMGLPPFQSLAGIIVRSADPLLACAESKRLYDTITAFGKEDVCALEPQQDRAAVVRGKFRYRISMHGADHQRIVGLIKAVLRTFRPKKDAVVTVNVE